MEEEETDEDEVEERMGGGRWRIRLQKWRDGKKELEMASNKRRRCREQRLGSRESTPSWGNCKISKQYILHNRLFFRLVCSKRYYLSLI